MKTGPKNLITDVAGLYVGNAQDDALKSGTTVLLGDHPFTASVHVMGGAPAKLIFWPLINPSRPWMLWYCRAGLPMG